MPGVYLIHFQEPLVPTFFSFAGIIKEGGECRIDSFYDPARATRHKKITNVQSFVHFIEYFRLIILYPFVFPHRIFSTGWSGMINNKIPHKFI